MTTDIPRKNRFRFNPIEIIIFSIALAVLGRSVYNLAQDPETLAAITAGDRQRGPASIEFAEPSALANLDIGCDSPSGEKETKATRIRLIGPICGLTGSRSKLSSISVVNTATHHTATVFTDLNQGKFSTDYISVGEGTNPIQIVFSFRDGRVVRQDFTLFRR